MSAEYREKLRSLSFVGTPVLQKVTHDHIDNGVVRTTEKNETQDITVMLDKPVTPHWKGDEQ